MTIYTIETAAFTGEELERMAATLPAERRRASLRIKREASRRDSLVAAYLVYYALAAGDGGGRHAPDTALLLSQEKQIAKLTDRIGWPVAASGKPFAEGVTVGDSLLFVSLSHSDGLVTVALHTAPVGVDVQRVPASGDRLLQIARRFHPGEAAMLEAVPEETLALAFCKVWACKESVMKLTGEGLRLPLSSFCVHLDGNLAASELRGRRVCMETTLLTDAVEAHAVWAQSQI